MRHCHGLNCTSTRLVDAHIIPKGFARIARADGKILEVISDRKPAVTKAQLGIFDSEILCASCDHKLGRFDDYLIEFCRIYSKKHESYSDLGFKVREVDADRLSKAILAILWRASISGRPECALVDFGQKYESIAREVLFGAKQLSTFSQFQSVLQLYMYPQAKGGFYTIPYRVRFDYLNMYVMSLVGFRILSKIDMRPLPTELRDWAIGSSPDIIGTKIALSETSEGRFLLGKANPWRVFR